LTVLQSDGFEDLRKSGKEGPFSLIATNPPIRAGKQTVHRLFEESLDWLTEGGELWIVIRKQQGAPSALAKLQQLFALVEEADKDKGYRVYRAVKSSTP
jgi:16S rRNA (guanine1207-N2)-methyltransferase